MLLLLWRFSPGRSAFEAVWVMISFNDSNANLDPTRCDTLNAIMNPVFSVLPLFWRMAQCLRRYYETKEVVHLPNALKYAVGFSVVLFSCLMGNYNGRHLPLLHS